jgi:hypothetical protein
MDSGTGPLWKSSHLQTNQYSQLQCPIGDLIWREIALGGICKFALQTRFASPSVVALVCTMIHLFVEEGKVGILDRMIRVASYPGDSCHNSSGVFTH